MAHNATFYAFIVVHFRDFHTRLPCLRKVNLKNPLNIGSRFCLNSILNFLQHRTSVIKQILTVSISASEKMTHGLFFDFLKTCSQNR